MSPDDETPDGEDRSADAGRDARPPSKPATKRPEPLKQPARSKDVSANSSAGEAAPSSKPASKSAGQVSKSAAKQAAAKQAAPKQAAPKKAALTKAAATKKATPEPPEVESQAATAAQPEVEGVPPQRTGWRLLIHVGRPRATRGQVAVALLCGLLGFALVTQVHSESNVGLSSARQADLVDVLDSLSAKSDQLRSQIANEQQSLSKLTGGTDQTQAALQEAQDRATTLQILAGTIGASGPGIDLHIDDPGHKVTADVLLDSLEELRDAGAEAVEIRGVQPRAGSGGTGSTANPSAPVSASTVAGSSAPLGVRLVASSYFDDPDDGQGVIVDGTLLLPPYDLLAIGDPPTLDQAMGIPGGVLDTLKGRSASGSVTQLSTVRITALHAFSPPKYARPATPSP
jgi:uncharacterized protein YlxW (UPF0749 family)